MKIEIDMAGIFNKFVWLMIAGSITFAAKKVNDMSNNIAELNAKMGSVITWQVDKADIMKDHEFRLRKLERPNAPF